jgi:hypothetical protein
VSALLLPVATRVTAAVGLDATTRVADLRAATSVIPAGARVAADNSSGPYLLGTAGGDHDVLGWSPDMSLDRLPSWVVLSTDQDSVATTSQDTRDWIAAVEGEPGVVVTRAGATAVVHLGVSP